MSDVQQRAAEVIAETPHGRDWDDESPVLIAAALAAAGLLADPDTARLRRLGEAVATCRKVPDSPDLVEIPGGTPGDVTTDAATLLDAIYREAGVEQ